MNLGERPGNLILNSKQKNKSLVCLKRWGSNVNRAIGNPVYLLGLKENGETFSEEKGQ